MRRISMTMERSRNPLREKQERRRFELLRAVHEMTGENCSIAISGLDAGAKIGMPREETFRHVQYLAHHGYLEYIGAGPTICIADRGARYLTREANRRRSVR